MELLGLDIGGTGIKAATVDAATGVITRERVRVKTPQPATPWAVAKSAADVIKHFEWTGPLGCGFPAVVKSGVVHTAANIDKSWIGTNAADLLSEASGCRVYALNDADAAGIAEMRFGAGQKLRGVVFMITIGTGIGTALFVNGALVPNTELGHLIVDGEEAEAVSSEAAKKREDLSWKDWAKRFNAYLGELDRLFWPDKFILGGGAVKKFETFGELLKLRHKITVAELRNNAGIVGAALHAAEQERARKRRG